MPEENFEQQVRRKAGEFGMEPNPGVWLHVKTAIAPAERRRKVLLWWWMLPLCVAGIVAVWPNYNRKPSSVERTSLVNTGGHLSIEKETISSFQKAGNESDDKKPLINKEERVTENPAFQKQIGTTTPADQNNGTVKYPSSEISPDRKPNTDNEKGDVIVRMKRESLAEGNEQTKTVTGSKLYASLQSEADRQQTSTGNDRIIITNEIKPDTTSVTVNDSLSKKSILVTGSEKKEKLTKKRSWQTGITAEIGLTSWGKDLLYNEVGSSGAFTTTDGIFWSVTARDSILNNTSALQQTKNGLTAAAGFVIRKEMQHHFYISGRLGYRYQQFTVYNLRTSSAPQPLGSVSYFVNKDNYHTHFFNLTISAGKRLLSNKRNAISAEAGIDNSFLFMLNRQNAEQSSAFNMAKSLDAGSFNRWQPHLVVSLPFDWHSAEKVRFVVSPFARFGLRTFQKNGNDYKDNHLISAGVQAVYFFK